MICREGTMTRHSFLTCCGLAVALTVSGPAWGQDYPNRQITILIGIAAGGITDVTTRQYAAVVSKNIDQQPRTDTRCCRWSARSFPQSRQWRPLPTIR
jgi:tripartite-type tricarboxylate transporter receptor subunit TctC